MDIQRELTDPLNIFILLGIILFLASIFIRIKGG